MVTLTLEEKIQNLSEKYQQLNSLATPELRKYFRLKTLSNLIYHLENIKNTRDQEWVYEGILNYMDEFLKAVNDMDREISVKLYTTYLRTITNHYNKYLGFEYYSTQVIVILYIVFITVLSFFMNIIILIGIALVTASFIFHYYYKKYKSKKLYGFFY